MKYEEALNILRYPASAEEDDWSEAIELSKEALKKQIEIENAQFTHICQSDKLYYPDTFSINAGIPTKTYIYARVSTYSQRADLDNQVELLKQFCFSRGMRIDGIFTDIASGISFDKRKEFFKMLDDILARKVKYVVVSYRDRLSRAGFELFKHLFSRFGVEIIVMSEVGSNKLDSEEIFEEIVSLLHCYSMKLYSKRRLDKLKEIIEDKSVE